MRTRACTLSRTTMLDDIKKTLWAAADKQRANLDAAVAKAGAGSRRWVSGPAGG